MSEVSIVWVKIECDIQHLRGVSDDTVRKKVQELGKPSTDKKTLSIRQRSESEQ